MPTPSLILVPARFKTGKLYTPVATTSGGVVLGASGDFNVTRATTATRVNASGLIESVASGIPRLDYFASGGVVGCPALLVEPSAANGILNSNNTATSWSRGANLTSGYVDVIGVSGNNLTVAVSGSNIGTGAGRLQSITNNVSLASGSTYTISFLMKKTGTHTIGGYYAVIGGLDIASGFDISGSFSSGSFYNSAPTTNRIRRVEQWGTDVYRCSETFTMTSGTTLTFLNFAPLSGVSNANNPVSGSQIAFAAPQIELGAIPTSFIPTTTAPVTRNADVISVSGAVSGCIGQTEGTIYAEVDIRNSVTAAVLGLDNNSTTDFIIVFRNSSRQITVTIRRANGSLESIITSSALAVGVHKIALGYTNGNYALYINGSLAGTSTNSVSFPTSLTACRIGANAFSSGTGDPFNDRIRAAALYTTRLTNAELATLTTP
jgi:hypothetical protein